MLQESELKSTASTSKGQSSRIDDLRDRDKIVIRPRSREYALKERTSTRRALGFFNSPGEDETSAAREKKDKASTHVPKEAPPKAKTSIEIDSDNLSQDVDKGSPTLPTLPVQTEIKTNTSTFEKPSFVPRVLTHGHPSSLRSGSIGSSNCSYSPISRPSHAAAYTRCPCATREVDCRRCRVLKLADRFSGLVDKRRKNMQRASVIT